MYTIICRYHLFQIPVSFTQLYTVLALISYFLIPFHILQSQVGPMLFEEWALKDFTSGGGCQGSKKVFSGCPG